jgi:O-acetyl-ADP-ribose deacetylase (regulator of RNase III)
MKFTIQPGDLLTKTGFIIHGCNDKGVMGSGVAAGVRTRFPDAHRIYMDAAKADMLIQGTNTIWRENYNTWIVNAVTQTLGGPLPLNYDALRLCFKNCLQYMYMLEIFEGRVSGSIPLNFPKIGAARAGGDWAKIVTIINEELTSIEQLTSVVRPAFCWTVDVEPVDCR